jgi:hypothetical protein
MTTTARALLSLLVALCLLAAGTATSTAQDAAEPDPTAIEVSLDGVRWTESITTPLFDPAVRWVPGDVRTARFFVRNNRDEQGDLRVVLQRAAQGELLDTGFLTVAARAGNGPWTEVASGGRQVLIDDDELDSDDEMAVMLRASMSIDAPNRTMVLATDLDLQIRLTQSGVVKDAGSGDGTTSGGQPFPGNPGAPGDPDQAGGADGPTAVLDGQGVDDDADGAGGSGGQALPDTGSALRPWVLPLALLLLTAGAVVLARRRDEDDEQLVVPAPISDARNPGTP